MNQTQERGRSRKKKPVNLHYLYRFRRLMAFILSFSMILGNVGNSASVALAGESGAKEEFRLHAEDIQAAAEKALSEGSAVSDNLGIGGKDKSLVREYEKLFAADGSLYEIFPAMEQVRGIEDIELRVFLRIAEGADPESYVLTGDEKLLFLYVNSGDQTTAGRLNIDGKVSGFTTVRPYDAVFGKTETPADEGGSSLGSDKGTEAGNDDQKGSEESTGSATEDSLEGSTEDTAGDQSNEKDPADVANDEELKEESGEAEGTIEDSAKEDEPKADEPEVKDESGSEKETPDAEPDKKEDSAAEAPSKEEVADDNKADGKEEAGSSKPEDQEEPADDKKTEDKADAPADAPSKDKEESAGDKKTEDKVDSADKKTEDKTDSGDKKDEDKEDGAEDRKPEDKADPVTEEKEDDKADTPAEEKSEEKAAPSSDKAEDKTNSSEKKDSKDASDDKGSSDRNGSGRSNDRTLKEIGTLSMSLNQVGMVAAGLGSDSDAEEDDHDGDPFDAEDAAALEEEEASFNKVGSLGGRTYNLVSLDDSMTARAFVVSLSKVGIDVEELEESETLSTDTWEAEADGIQVTINAPDGAFPEGTTVEVNLADTDAVAEAVMGELEEKGFMIADISAVDITFYDQEHNEIQPSEGKLFFQFDYLRSSELLQQ